MKDSIKKFYGCRCFMDEYNKKAMDKEFRLQLLKEIKNHHHDLLFLRECLIKYKNNGMDKERMLKNLEKMRSNSDLETEDILLELMDFVTGYCRSEFSIFT